MISMKTLLLHYNITFNIFIHSINTRKPIFFFFFNDTATTEIYTLSLHDALPICDPAYPDDCLQDGIGDWDCADGSGNGPNYVEGPLTVRPPDPFDLDRNHNGVGCEERNS